MLCVLVNWDENKITSVFSALLLITREQVSEITTWSSQKLNIPLFRTASGQRTCYYRTVKLWTNLESFLSQSVEIFKRSLRSQLLDNFVNTS